ncbi:hypothetical protein C8J57DRAFT_1653545 [Mycena rebaudengoi]|nr:hypothetical protein C8J57DRAFT_1653545 [Mycena rebaudengoi]
MHLTPERERELVESNERDRRDGILEREQRDGKTVADFTGTDFDQAVHMLRKHNGDVQKTIDAMLNAEEDHTERDHVGMSATDEVNIRESFQHMFPSDTRDDVIDLTGKDDNRLDPNFRVSTRSPDPSWQLVTTNQPTTSVKSHEDELKEVILASYNDFAADESDTVPPEELSIREGGRWVADYWIVLRADDAQVLLLCERMWQGKHMRLYSTTLLEVASKPHRGRTRASQKPSRTSSRRGKAEPLTSQMDSVGSFSNSKYPLFHFTHSRVDVPVRGSPESRLELDKGHIVQLEISHETPPNELVSHIHDDGSSSHELISTPSEMVTFLIDVRPGLSAGTSSPEPFSYPKTIYMDQFIEKNLDLANETRAEQRQAQKDIEILTAQKRNITRFEDQDSLENLRGAIHYYKEVARCDTPERLDALRVVSTKLENTLRKLEADVISGWLRVDIYCWSLNDTAEIDQELLLKQAELDGLFQNPELSPVRFTGPEAHIFVPEELVLSDPAGLHLSAGPYMLMYSRRQSEDEKNAPISWPPLFVDAVSENNSRLIQESQAAKAGTLVDHAMDLTP